MQPTLLPFPGRPTWLLTAPRSLILLTALWLAAGGAVRAGLNEWSSLGPPGGDVGSLAISPENPAVLYAGTQRHGVFRSVDGGASWTQASTGIPEGSVVYALAVAPDDSSTLYAGTFGFGFNSRSGVFKSVDGGTSWVDVSHGSFFTAVHQLVIDPTNSSTLYAVSGGVLKSIDGGGSWGHVDEGLQGTVNALVIDPTTPSTLYAGSTSGRVSGVFKSIDGGLFWRKLVEAYVLSLAMVPGDPAVVYAGTSQDILRSTDGGDSWRTVGSGLGHHFVALAAHPEDSDTLYASSADAGMFKSVDGGLSWSHAGTGLVRTAVQALVIDPESPFTLYAGTDRVGVFKSIDGATTWEGAHSGFPKGWVAALVTAGRWPTSLYATTFRGLFKNTGGLSWTDLSSGLPRGASLTALAVDPNRPTTLYAGDEGGILKSVDGGLSWIEVANFPFDTTVSLTIDPTSSSTLYAGTFGGRFGATKLIKSSDSGESWSLLARHYVLSLAIDPQDSSVLYSGGDLHMYKSLDAGASWTEARDGLPEEASVQALALDPSRPAIVYLGSDYGVFKSVDGAQSWAPASAGLPESVTISALGIHPTNSSVLYAGSRNHGVFLSLDGGAFWSELNAGLTGDFIEDLIFDPGNPSTLYSATHDGVFHLTLADCESPFTLCLQKDRFVVEADWRDFVDRTGPARAASARARDSGLLWFFSSGNWEVLVKTLDGCGVNGHFWVFSAATTNVEYTLWVTDTVTGSAKSYFNHLGQPATALTDTRAFAACEER